MDKPREQENEIIFDDILKDDDDYDDEIDEDDDDEVIILGSICEDDPAKLHEVVLLQSQMSNVSNSSLTTNPPPADHEKIIVEIHDHNESAVSSSNDDQDTDNEASNEKWGANGIVSICKSKNGAIETKTIPERFFERRAFKRNRLLRRQIMVTFVACCMIVVMIVVPIVRKNRASKSDVTAADTSVSGSVTSESENIGTSQQGQDPSVLPNAGIVWKKPGTPPNNNFEPTFINAGGKNIYVDSFDKIWIPDSTFDQDGWTSNSCTNVTTESLSEYGMDEYNLYCSQRWFDFERDDELDPTTRIGNKANGEIEIPVPNGSYKLILHFAETDKSIQVGDRVFDIHVEGSLVRSRFDIMKGEKNHPSTSSNKTKSVSNHPPFIAAFVRVPAVAMVNDGSITIAFRPIKNEPKINALEIYPMLESPAVRFEYTKHV